MQLVYRNEERLFRWMLAWSVLIWGLLVVGTFGLALLYVLFGFLFYCVAQSALVSCIKGNGVRITDEQFPDLKRQISACCRKLELDEEPQAYLMQLGGMLSAFATRFLGRAREYTCDRHGLAACDNPLNAEHGLAVLAAGGKRARMINKQAYIDQVRQAEGFWMSFHELVGDYPWLVKRMAAVRALAAGHELRQPPRSRLAALLALFVPRTGVGASDAAPEAGAGTVNPGDRASTPSSH